MSEGRVVNGESLSGILSGLGLSYKDIGSLISAGDTVADMASLKAGNGWQAYSSNDSLKYFLYSEDKVHTLVFKCYMPFDVHVVSKTVDEQLAYTDVAIHSSLWNDMISAGATPSLILDLSEIYAWTVDFFGLQPNDRFRVLYKRRVCSGEVISIDTIYYAVFSHNGKDYPAIRFDRDENESFYWDASGRSLRKSFLKAPLKYSRVSSRFSFARRNPVTGVVCPHTGVDYAAPRGTPVVAVGDGTVLKAAWSGAGGNMVKIRHNSVYTTAYMHLSRYGKGIRSGKRVTQGQVIGYVGSTGRSTGPHLDFRIWKNGSPLNPLSFISPPAAPLKEENRAAFDSVYAGYKSITDSLSLSLKEKRMK